MGLTNRGFEIKIVKSKRPENAKHDVKLPLISKTTLGMPEGKYFICQFRPSKELDPSGKYMRYPSTTRINETVFNNNYVFDGILEALSNPENYTIESDEGILIHPSVFSAYGVYVEKNTPGNRLYKMVDGEGKPLLKQDNTPRFSSTVRFFVHEDKDADVLYQQELARIDARNLWATADPEPGEDDKK